MTTERRSAIELRAVGTRLEGYAAVFNSPSKDLGGFFEIVKPGAFTRTLADNDDVTALYDHDARSVLGRLSAGTLRLAEDERGLKFSIDTPPTTIGRDLLISVERGDINGASFAFIADDVEWAYHDDKPSVRTLISVKLLDVTVTPNPAYPETSVARRALETHQTPASLAYIRRELTILELENGPL